MLLEFPVSKTHAEWKKTGDLGNVAENLISKKKQQTLASLDLTVKKVFSNLRKLAESNRPWPALTANCKLIAELLISASGTEPRYIARTVLGVLRVGLGEGTLRDAIVWAYFMKVTADISQGRKGEIQRLR